MGGIHTGWLRWLAGALGRRIVAARLVWKRGEAHVRVLGTDPRGRLSLRPRVRLPSASIDRPPAGSTVARGVIQVSGWAATAAGPCSRVELAANGQHIGPARLGYLRPDVPGPTGVAATLLSGFELAINLAEVQGLGSDLELSGTAVGVDGTTVAIPAVSLSVEAHRSADGSGSLIGVPAYARWSRKHAEALKLLIFTHELGYGGAQLFLAEMLRAFGDREPIEGLVVTPSDGPTRGLLEQCGFSVHVTAPFPVSSPAAYQARVEELAGFLSHGDYDAALINTALAFPGADVCTQLRVPAVWAIHESYTLPEFWATYGEGLHERVRGRGEEALRAAALAAFVADATRALYEPYLPEVECKTLRYGVDIDALDRWRAGFDRDGARRSYGISPEACVLLCIGSVEPRKAQTELIYAFSQIAARHPDAQLLVVGGRDDQYALAAHEAVTLHGLDGRARVMPVVADARPLYGIADMLVSASDLESAPRSMLEAMALRLPILSTDVFGVPELVVGGKTGWLFPARDVAAMAKALDEVLSLEPRVRAQVAERARAAVERDYRSDDCSAGWLEALRGAAVSRRPTPRADFAGV